MNTGFYPLVHKKYIATEIFIALTDLEGFAVLLNVWFAGEDVGYLAVTCLLFI